MPTYKALSIRQPYADWICNPEKLKTYGIPPKDVENRDWATSYRGLVLIHAGKTFEDDAVASWQYTFPLLGLRVSARKRDYALGAIVGVATMTACVASSESDWFVGDYGFVLKNARALKEPIPYRGSLGFFPVTLDIDLEDSKYYASPSSKFVLDDHK